MRREKLAGALNRVAKSLIAAAGVTRGFENGGSWIEVMALSDKYIPCSQAKAFLDTECKMLSRVVSMANAKGLKCTTREPFVYGYSTSIMCGIHIEVPRGLEDIANALCGELRKMGYKEMSF